MSTGNGNINSGSAYSNTAGDTSQNQNVTAAGTATTTRDITAAQGAALNTAENNMNNVSGILQNVDNIGQATVMNALQTSMPATSSAGKQSGGYDSTTKSMLDSFNENQAAMQGSIAAGTNLANVTNAESNSVNAAAAAANATAGNTVNTTGGSKTSGNTGSNSTTLGSNIASGASGGTVICTQLMLDGNISLATYSKDCNFVDTYFNSNAVGRNIVNGYRFLGVPFVIAMRKHSWIYALGKYIGLFWSNHCVRRTLLGYIAILLFAPLLLVLGTVLPEVKYYKLWKGS